MWSSDLTRIWLAPRYSSTTRKGIGLLRLSRQMATDSLNGLPVTRFSAWTRETV